MSIHMHDLQVQNKITSKNEIETKKLQASMATIAQLSIQHNEDATTIKGDRVKFDSELDVDGDCHINGELNIGPNFETVVTYDGLAEETIQIAGYDIKILGGSLETDDLAISLSESSKLIPQKAMSAEALTTTNIGSLACPVYFDKDGKPQECTNVQAAVAQFANQSDVALKAQALDVTLTNGGR